MRQAPDADATRLSIERRDNGVVVLTLNRPEAKNAVSFQMWREFAALLDELERETPARALVLTGAGGFFCIGGDLKIPPRERARRAGGGGAAGMGSARRRAAHGPTHSSDRGDRGRRLRHRLESGSGVRCDRRRRQR